MRQDVYRTAYDEAQAELSELVHEFERLNARKEQLEKLRDTLKPLADAQGEQQESAPDGQVHSYNY